MSKTLASLELLQLTFQDFVLMTTGGNNVYKLNPFSQEKRRYKMYKAGRHWVYSAIAVLGGAGILMFQPTQTVFADEASPTASATTLANRIPNSKTNSPLPHHRLPLITPSPALTSQRSSQLKLSQHQRPIKSKRLQQNRLTIRRQRLTAMPHRSYQQHQPLRQKLHLLQPIKLKLLCLLKHQRHQSWRQPLLRDLRSKQSQHLRQPNHRLIRPF